MADQQQAVEARTAEATADRRLDLGLWTLALDRLIDRAEGFRQTSLNVSRAIHQKVLEGGREAREVADVLHGKQLGHPLHPVLTDLTIGSWAFGFLFDVVGILPGARGSRRQADRLTLLGTISAVGTALTGLADYSTIKQRAAGYGAAHGLLNSVAFYLYARSVIARMSGRRIRALVYSLAGIGLVTVSAWLGGDLVYRHRIGVNHTPASDLDDWATVMPLADLAESQPTRAEVNGTALLLFRQGEAVSAINAVCSHAGGPLDQGNVVDGVCIECPWHQSVFDMRDGRVVHGPATYAEPRYAVRIQDGRIQVRSEPDA